ncbi:unnamed protein product [Rhizophagus irregularis]|nr:unnamed protein product [Rhizophagus irregularis]
MLKASVLSVIKDPERLERGASEVWNRRLTNNGHIAISKTTPLMITTKFCSTVLRNKAQASFASGGEATSNCHWVCTVWCAILEATRYSELEKIDELKARSANLEVENFDFKIKGCEAHAGTQVYNRGSKTKRYKLESRLAKVEQGSPIVNEQPQKIKEASDE